MKKITLTIRIESDEGVCDVNFESQTQAIQVNAPLYPDELCFVSEIVQLTKRFLKDGKIT